MEPKTPKCPACGSEIELSHATLNADSVYKVTIQGERERREAWKDRILVSASSPVLTRICADCGHISFWASDLAALRNAAAKIDH